MYGTNLVLGRFRALSVSQFIYPFFGVTLQQNQREWYYAKLDERFPGLKMKYVRRYGNAYECVSPRAKQLWRLFSAECDRLGLLYKMEDVIQASRRGYQARQLSFF
jgi:hypothetical protein